MNPARPLWELVSSDQFLGFIPLDLRSNMLVRWGSKTESKKGRVGQESSRIKKGGLAE